MSANTYLPISPVTPPFLIITAITQAVTAVITVSTANNYIVGQLVHLCVPPSYGMTQADQLTGQIISVDITNLIFTTSIDTSKFDAFSVPTGNVQQPATITPAGSRNLYNIATVPFHSLGNTGN